MEEKRDKIEGLREQLYSRTDQPYIRPRRQLHDNGEDVQHEWQHGEQVTEPQAQPMGAAKQKRSKLTTVLLASVGFFVVAVGLAAYFLLAGSNVISAKNVDITIDGPTATAGGDTLSLQIIIKNRNDVAMELADLIVEYPQGTHSATDLNTELPRYRESLGTIAPGEEIRRTVQAVLFGGEGSEQDITATVEYRVKDSNAIFYKDGTYHVLISSSPLSLAVEAVNQTTSGQEIEMAVRVRSNATAVLHDVLLRAEYPFGFSYAGATPEPAFASNIWELGDLPPGVERVIRIRGSLAGQENEERVFKFASGIQSETDEHKLAAAFITDEHTINVKRPFLAAEIAVAGERTGTYIARGGEQIRVDITLTNTLPDKIFDAAASLKLSGTAVDRSSVSVTGGFFQSSNNTIVWNRNSDSNLAEIAAGEKQTLSFVFKPLAGSSLAALRNPDISLELSVAGRRVAESGAPEAINASVSRTVQVSTDVQLGSNILHFSGPFSNSGPMPPAVERETTYTVTWTVTNGANAVSDAVVSAVLPSYVRWLGVTSPGSEDVSFNPVGGKVVWRVGELNAGTGNGSTARSASFQIGFVPSLSQVGQNPTLINTQTLQGTDRFTGQPVSSSRGAMTTILTGDPQFGETQGRVVE